MHATRLDAAGDEAAFRRLTDPYRHELQLHCYRMLGSVQDAEDLLQETLLAAWRGLDRFEGRTSMRSWLYRIATNRCLNALRDGGRRPQRAGARELEWLQPYPDTLLERIPDRAPGPEARVEAREAVGLAFVAGLQHLPPAQRAVVVLRDVRGFRAAEAAEIVESSPAAVNSLLQRARATLQTRVTGGVRERAPAPRSSVERELMGRFADAFERGDVDGIVSLLTDDALLTMPPQPLEVRGRAAIGRFLATVPAGGDLRRFRMLPTRANGQPAFAFYLADAGGTLARATGIDVLTLAGDRIAAITVFHDAALLARFGAPDVVVGPERSGPG